MTKHATSISFALDEEQRAATELATALGLNPAFHPIFASQAEAMMREAGR